MCQTARRRLTSWSLQWLGSSGPARFLSSNTSCSPLAMARSSADIFTSVALPSPASGWAAVAVALPAALSEALPASGAASASETTGAAVPFKAAAVPFAPAESRDLASSASSFCLAAASSLSASSLCSALNRWKLSACEWVALCTRLPWREGTAHAPDVQMPRSATARAHATREPRMLRRSVRLWLGRSDVGNRKLCQPPCLASQGFWPQPQPAGRTRLLPRNSPLGPRPAVSLCEPFSLQGPMGSSQASPQPQILGPN